MKMTVLLKIFMEKKVELWNKFIVDGKKIKKCMPSRDLHRDMRYTIYYGRKKE